MTSRDGLPVGIATARRLVVAVVGTAVAGIADGAEETVVSRPEVGVRPSRLPSSTAAAP